MAGEKLQGIVAGSQMINQGFNQYWKAKQDQMDREKFQIALADRQDQKESERRKQYEDRPYSPEELSAFQTKGTIPSDRPASRQDVFVKEDLAARRMKMQEDMLDKKLQSQSDIADKRIQASEDLADKRREKGESAAAKEKRVDAGIVSMGKDLDPSQFRAGAFGVSKQVFDRSERLQTLDDAVQSFQKGNPDSRQMEEMAIGINSMLSGSNAGAQEQVKSLVPNTIWGNAKKMTEWVKNEPTGLDQQKFLQRMMQTVQREKDTTNNQIKRTRFQRLSKWDHIRKDAPKDWENVVKSFEVDPKEYDTWKTNGYKIIDASQTPVKEHDGKSKEYTYPSGRTVVWDGSKWNPK